MSETEGQAEGRVQPPGVQAHPLHPLLKRQLRKSGLPEDLEGSFEGAWLKLLKHVNNAYLEADQDRYTLERSISISSREMQELYRDLKYSQLLLAQERDRLDGILGSLKDVVWSAQPDQRALLYVNPAFLQVYGRPEAELYAHPALWQDVAVEEDIPAVSEASSALAREGFWEHEYRIRKPDGGERWVRHKMQLIRNPAGMPMRIDSICFDITDKKAVELEMIKARDAAESLARVKTQFMANMSHEIRTPMNGLMGMVQLLMGTDLTENQRKMAQVVLDSSHSLLAILNDILDLAKLEHGKMTIREEPFDLRRTLEDVAALMRPQASGKGLRFELHLDGGIPPTVAGDALRLRQILLNLLGNAVKFTDRGKVEIRASLRPGPEGRKDLACEVVDTGPGIPGNVDLFLPFNQVDASNTRKHGGTGLGLFISKELIGRMGGSIGYESTLGEGSRFWFTMPIREHRAPQGAPEPAPSARRTLAESRPDALRVQEPAEPFTGSGGEATLLVVEDNPVNQRVFQSMLEHLGYACKVVSNGKEALDAMGADRFDLVFMDCQMPVMDGYEAVRCARTGPLAHTGIIIAMTAHALDGDREKCLRIGMDDYLAKPVSLDSLKRMLEKWLKPIRA